MKGNEEMFVSNLLTTLIVYQTMSQRVTE